MLSEKFPNFIGGKASTIQRALLSWIDINTKIYSKIYSVIAKKQLEIEDKHNMESKQVGHIILRGQQKLQLTP